MGLHISACEWQELSCVIHTSLVLERGDGTGCTHFLEDRCTFQFLESRLSFLALIHSSIDRETTVTAAFCI
jgi:hypothetical protein